MTIQTVTLCRICSQPLLDHPVRGWLHEEGGIYAMRCDRCNAQSATDPLPASCPTCGEDRKWRLHHSARPAGR